MSDITLQFIGWCHEDNHDKVWTSFIAEGKHYCAWGRRGAKLQFKRHPHKYSLELVQRKKEGKYKEVDSFLLFSLFPDFVDKVSEELLMETLRGKVR